MASNCFLRIAIQDRGDRGRASVGREPRHRNRRVELNRIAEPTLKELGTHAVRHVLEIDPARFEGSFRRFPRQSMALQAVEPLVLFRQSLPDRG